MKHTDEGAKRIERLDLERARREGNITLKYCTIRGPMDRGRPTGSNDNCFVVEGRGRIGGALKHEAVGGYRPPGTGENKGTVRAGDIIGR